MKKKDKEVMKKMMVEWTESMLDDHIPLLKIVWKDAHTFQGTSSFKEIKAEKDLKAFTIGYLIDETEEHYAICSFLFPDEEHGICDNSGDNHTSFRDVHYVPKKMVETIIELKVDYERSKKWRKTPEEKGE